MERHVLRRLAQVATAITAVLILYATLSPAPPHLTALPHLAGPTATVPSAWTAAREEAAGHAGLFALLGASVALWYAASDRARRSPRRALLTTMLALWLFGGLTELAQGLTGTRTPQMSDLGFDVLGAFAGFLAGGAAWRLLLTRMVR